MAGVNTAEEATKAVIALHNFLMHGRNENRNNYCPPEFLDREINGTIIPGEWKNYEHNQGLANVTNLGTSNSHTKSAKQVTDFRDYFNSEEG